MKKFIFGFLILAFSASLLQAQNINISQFDNNPLFVNPGMTGDFEGRLRVNGYHRNQWTNVLDGASYQTYTLSVDSRFPLGKNTDIGIGIAGLNESSGSLNYTVKTYQVSTALHSYIGERYKSHHTLSLGVSAGPASQSLDIVSDDFVWSSEHDGNGGNTGISPGIMDSLRNIDSYPLLSTGLMWSYRSTSRFSARAGVATYGLNRPSVSFVSDSGKPLPIFWTLIGQVELPFANRFSVIPSAYYVKTGSMDQLTFGTFGRFYNSGESNQRFIQVGIFGKTTRNPEFDIFFNQVYSIQARFQRENFSIGYAFDRHNLSGLPSGSTHEFSLGYLIGKANK